MHIPVLTNWRTRARAREDWTREYTRYLEVLETNDKTGGNEDGKPERYLYHPAFDPDYSVDLFFQRSGYVLEGIMKSLAAEGILNRSEAIGRLKIYLNTLERRIVLHGYNSSWWHGVNLVRDWTTEAVRIPYIKDNSQ